MRLTVGNLPAAKQQHQTHEGQCIHSYHNTICIRLPLHGPPPVFRFGIPDPSESSLARQGAALGHTHRTYPYICVGSTTRSPRISNMRSPQKAYRCSFSLCVCYVRCQCRYLWKTTLAVLCVRHSMRMKCYPI